MENKIDYSSFFRGQFIAGLILLAVGITSIIFYDYGLIVFLFSLPQFFHTGLIPLFFGILIVVRCIVNREKVKLEQVDDDLVINVSKKLIKLKVTEIKIKKSEIRYCGLRYKETRELRWLIIIILVVYAIEVHFQNVVDIYGYARIAPMLGIWTILMFSSIVIFTFSPRRYLELANNEETLFIPFKSLQVNEISNLLKMCDVNNDAFTRSKFMKKITSNILSQFEISFT